MGFLLVFSMCNFESSHQFELHIQLFCLSNPSAGAHLPVQKKLPNHLEQFSPRHSRQSQQWPSGTLNLCPSSTAVDGSGGLSWKGWRKLESMMLKSTCGSQPEIHLHWQGSHWWTPCLLSFVQKQSSHSFESRSIGDKAFLSSPWWDLGPVGLVRALV